MRSIMVVPACGLLLMASLSGGFIRWGALIAALLLCAFTFYWITQEIPSIADYVYDCGDHLQVYKDDRTIQIDLSNIDRIDFSFWISPMNVKLTLIEPCILGSTIAFLPQNKFSFFNLFSSRQTIAQELRERLPAAKHRHRVMHSKET
jgi:hypothetical protein